MPRIMMWLLGCGLAAILAVTGVAPPAIADSSTPGDGYTAPAPTKVDPSGSDQDQYCIPSGSFIHPVYGFGSYKVNEVPLDEGCYSTDGAAEVTITTSYHSGTWTFDYSDEQTGEEAENTYSVEVGDVCYTNSFGDHYREATAYFTNEPDNPDKTGGIVHSIYPYASSATAGEAVDTVGVDNIVDGATVSMPLIMSADILPGLVPGKYKVSFWRDDTEYAGNLHGYIVKTMWVDVPSCGGDNPDGTSRQARGKLGKAGCHVVRVTANTRGFTLEPDVTYRVFRKTWGRAGHTRTMVVQAGQKRVVYLRNFGHRWARVKLTAQRPNGHWANLDRLRMPRCR